VCGVLLIFVVEKRYSIISIVEVGGEEA